MATSRFPGEDPECSGPHQHQTCKCINPSLAKFMHIHPYNLWQYFMVVSCVSRSLSHLSFKENKSKPKSFWSFCRVWTLQGLHQENTHHVKRHCTVYICTKLMTFCCSRPSDLIRNIQPHLKNDPPDTSSKHCTSSQRL